MFQIRFRMFGWGVWAFCRVSRRVSGRFVGCLGRVFGWFVGGVWVGCLGVSLGGWVGCLGVSLGVSLGVPTDPDTRPRRL